METIEVRASDRRILPGVYFLKVDVQAELTAIVLYPLIRWNAAKYRRKYFDVDQFQSA